MLAAIAFAAGVWMGAKADEPTFVIEVKWPRDPAGWRAVAGAENFKACMTIAAAHAKYYDKRATEPPRVRCTLSRGAPDGIS